MGKKRPVEARRQVAIVVAHPDDETLWAGGTILGQKDWDCFVASLCRGDDPDRAPKFARVLQCLGARGRMATLDDGPGQKPLPDAEAGDTILRLLPDREFDLVLTHGPRGEYTRHLRHEETSKAVIALWESGRMRTRALWLFAYEDGGGKYLPRAHAAAHRKVVLPDEAWQEKHRIITEVYGFATDTLEARTTPREEAFWCFTSPLEVRRWIDSGGAGDEDSRDV